MSNYVKATNFTAKDSLITGNPAKIIKGAEIDDEFNLISTAIATKPDSNSPTLTGIPVAPTAPAGTNTTQIATTAFVTNVTSTLGTMSTQNANAVAITGGTISGASISGTRITGYSPNGGSSGAVTLADAPGNPNAVYLQATNNAANSQYSTLYFNSNGTISASAAFSASSFSGAGTGLTGTANSLNAGIGVNQTWQTPGRVAGQQYTNNTGRPIQVSIVLNATQGGDFGGTLLVNGVLIAQQVNYASNAGYKTTLTAIVPAGSTYQMNFTRNASLDSWRELSQ